MAESNLQKYTTEERLNKMDVDLIDVSIAVDADASGELLGDTTEISNAVAVNGGTAILQSAVLVSSKVLTDAVEIVITSDDTSIGTIGANLSDVSTTTAAVADGICGTFSITNLTDIGEVALGSKQNIGMVCKAESNSKNLHVWLIAKGSTDWDVDSVILRLGFIKD
tara:strand:+ start:2144 stop:2644 length:501 start_codon:yes stop_codon:yes gene_type:complete